jgi:transposase
MSVMLLPLAAEPAGTTPAPDPASLLEEPATLRLENAALRLENEALRVENAALRVANAARQDRIRELEARLGQTSANSSRPRSSDPPQAPARPQAPPSGRKRGGQPGHRGVCRALLPAEQVDESVGVVPERCRHCEHPFPEPAGGRQARVWRHQVVELLPLSVQVTEYQMAVRRGAECGKRTRAELPAASRGGRSGCA